MKSAAIAGVPWCSSCMKACCTGVPSAPKTTGQVA